eukprot:scaffold15723_cov128-Isochrysis_galbana.AAC.3
MEYLETSLANNSEICRGCHREQAGLKGIEADRVAGKCERRRRHGHCGVGHAGDNLFTVRQSPA